METTGRWREALLIEGARRVGKSTLAETFAKEEYRSYILIDFARLPKDVKAIFEEQQNDFDTLFMLLSAYYQVQLHERDSLIIFDEVQQFPHARGLIKYLVADGRYDYMETGSLVSIKKNVRDIVIPSEERKFELNPFDFEEFCWAMNEKALSDAIRLSYEQQKPLPDALHKRAYACGANTCWWAACPKLFPSMWKAAILQKSTTLKGGSSIFIAKI